MPVSLNVKSLCWSYSLNNNHTSYVLVPILHFVGLQ